MTKPFVQKENVLQFVGLVACCCPTMRPVMRPVDLGELTNRTLSSRRKNDLEIWPEM